jgi:glycosyltransferase involved in cell wall biosynthesis
MTPPRVLVVMPAHEEERVVQRGVRSLLAADGVDVRVLVVANGCTDATADRVRDLGDPRVDVLELAEGGKARAVRAAFTRVSAADDVVVVVDADVVLDAEALPALAEALAVPEARIAAPGLRLDLAGCTPLARRYCRTWLGEPHMRDDIGARGVYAVNRAGFDRLASMPPDLVADDGWARARFAARERVVTAGTSTVRPARTIPAHVRRRTRVIAGNVQLREVLPPSERPRPLPGDVVPAPPRSTAQRWREEGTLGTAVWAAVELPARAVSWWRRRRGAPTPWGRDATTRV